MKDPKGRDYFVNKETNETSWELPKEAASAKAAASKRSKDGDAEHEQLMRAMLYLLVNLTFSNRSNIDRIVNAGGIPVAKKCLNAVSCDENGFMS